ncbi:hypothetical protein FYJ45_23565 [Eisenbergiella tayi]|uniref:Uncharacterized protein n=1 Tax=Eisenbergiella porci TaxID=2652274 RepID=A0A6N7WMU6_9FIRM|nr:hypothetical protein [Eisenbergiella massiliensis]MSS91105.1 hypothetical protein [Eisenbergiella porci]
MQLNFRQKKRQLSKADITVRQVFVPAGTVFNVRRTHKKSLRPLPLLTEEGPEAFFYNGNVRELPAKWRRRQAGSVPAGWLV